MNRIDTSAEQEQNQLGQAAENQAGSRRTSPKADPRAEKSRPRRARRRKTRPEGKTPRKGDRAPAPPWTTSRAGCISRAQTISACNLAPLERTNQDQQADSEELRLTRAELQKLVDQRANELAPKIKQQSDEAESRRKVVEKLSESWGRGEVRPACQ